jgi:cbb3-type cytochrome oxidase maturation protein
MWTLYFLIFVTLTLGVGAYLLFLWSVKRGQFDDVEGPKYRMLDDDDDMKPRDDQQKKH